jgi:hypothetical protein
LVANLSQASPVFLVRPDGNDGRNNTEQEECARPDSTHVVNRELMAKLILLQGLHSVVDELRDKRSLDSRLIISQCNLVSSEGRALAPDGEGRGIHSS